MMLERFTDDARQVLVQAQAAARRLGHDFIGCEHLLLAAASTGTPASLVLRDQGVSPERIEKEILYILRPGRTVDLLGGLDREALASIGIELDVVRTRLEAAFGPDALARAAPACRRNRRPAWGKGPVAELMRRRRRRRIRGSAALPTGPARRGHALPFHGAGPSGHIPFTPAAKKSLERSLREAVALKDNHIGVQHLALALLTMNEGTVPVILSALGASNTSLRAAILDRYRKAS
jgi:Clp amino terminal domain, pathogenicity island component